MNDERVITATMPKPRSTIKVTDLMKDLGLKSFPDRVRTWPPSLCYQDTGAEWRLTEAGVATFLKTSRVAARAATQSLSYSYPVARALRRFHPRMDVKCGKIIIECVLSGVIAMESTAGKSPRQLDTSARHMNDHGYVIYRYDPSANSVFDIIGDLVELLNAL